MPDALNDGLRRPSGASLSETVAHRVSFCLPFFPSAFRSLPLPLSFLSFLFPPSFLLLSSEPLIPPWFLLGPPPSSHLASVPFCLVSVVDCYSPELALCFAFLRTLLFLFYLYPFFFYLHHFRPSRKGPSPFGTVLSSILPRPSRSTFRYPPAWYSAPPPSPPLPRPAYGVVGSAV